MRLHKCSEGCAQKLMPAMGNRYQEIHRLRMTRTHATSIQSIEQACRLHLEALLLADPETCGRVERATLRATHHIADAIGSIQI